MNDIDAIGWQNFFQQQLAPEDLEAKTPARVSAVHRSEIELHDGKESTRIKRNVLPVAEIAIGDWLLLDAKSGRPVRLLDRRSLIYRKAPGEKAERQLIAANIDTLFIVSSCNADFKESRIERYLALAHEADVFPVVILTKADTVDDASHYRLRAEKLQPGLVVECVNALDSATLAGVRIWCGAGQTVALVGSSGVGKSTLTNSLAGSELATYEIREDDARGRHMTTYRSLHTLADGGVLIDSPGMRELQVADIEHGLEGVFSEIVALAERCQFKDCGHHAEPGCAIQAALADGSLDKRRWQNYSKLLREQAYNGRTLAESREYFREQGKLFKRIQNERRKHKGVP